MPEPTQTVAPIVEGESQFGISPLVLAAMVRITTKPRVFWVPSAIEEAFAFCKNLVGRPHCNVVRPGERHFDIFQRLCIEIEILGPRVTDAWFATLVIEWGCDWITLDRDFARFPGLTWNVPTMR